VIRNFEAKPLLKGVKEKVKASQQTIIESVIELYKSDSLYVYTLAISINFNNDNSSCVSRTDTKSYKRDKRKYFNTKLCKIERLD